MQANIVEQLSIMHAGMVAAYKVFPCDGMIKNPIRNHLVMRAQEFRPYIGLAKKHPESFLAVFGNPFQLLGFGKRQGRYARDLVGVLAENRMAARYESHAVLQVLSDAHTLGMGSSVSMWNFEAEARKENGSINNRTLKQDVKNYCMFLYRIGVIAGYTIGQGGVYRFKLNEANPLTKKLLAVVKDWPRWVRIDEEAQ